MGVQLTSDEYQALVTFLAHVKDTKDLTEAVGRFGDRFVKSLVDGMSKIEDAVRQAQGLPKIKRELVISSYSKQTRDISLYATPDAAREVEQFGYLYSSRTIGDRYQLWVDARFDFDEVLA